MLQNILKLQSFAKYLRQTLPLDFSDPFDLIVLSHSATPEATRIYHVYY